MDAYVEEHGVLVNPLLQDGYASIGCAPCTRRVLPGEDPRAGRWAGRGKTECGLHVMTDRRRSAGAGATTSATGATVWLTGLPSAGKTTIARALAERLRAEGRRVEVLDGDEIREFLSAGPGLQPPGPAHQRDADRLRRRTARVQRRAWRWSRSSRRTPTAARRSPSTMPRAGTAYLEVHIATPVEVCSARDVKGLYAKQAAGELSGLTGVDDPYEVPETPDLRIQSPTSRRWQESARRCARC